MGMAQKPIPNRIMVARTGPYKKKTGAPHIATRAQTVAAATEERVVFGAPVAY